MANRLFGSNEAALGKVLHYQNSRPFIVTGVFENLPPTSSEYFQFVLSFEVYKELNPWVLSWGNSAPKTFVLLHKGIDFEAFNKRIDQFNNIPGGSDNIAFFAYKYSDLYLKGEFGEGNMAPKIRACLRFIENGGSKSVITEATKLEDRTYGTKITMEYED